MKLAELIGELPPSVNPFDHIAGFERLLRQARSIGPDPDYEAIAQINLAVVNALHELIGSAPLKELTALLYFRTLRIWHKTIPQLDWTEERRLVIAESRRS